MKLYGLRPRLPLCVDFVPANNGFVPDLVLVRRD